MLKISRLCSVAPRGCVLGVNFSNETKGQKILHEEKMKMEMDAKRLDEWRERPQEKEWKSKLSVFRVENEDPGFMTFMQKPWSVSGVMSWYQKKKELVHKLSQDFNPERHTKLGSDLAAAHFIVFRGGRVKFLGHKEWIVKDEEDEFGDNYNLPRFYDEKYKLEAIDCSRMVLYYQGLSNLRRLYYLKSLSFRDVELFDDWCLDRVSGSECENLEELDLVGTKVTAKSLPALYRMPQLKRLSLNLPEEEMAAAEMKLTGAMLQEICPELTVSYQ
ncbi:distal membrane-arm assembly complex protein 2 [Phlebotomus argentipes]|uniref:distal membrane-arm assembly complex protein 2 n=1 Tax=Phlebotomus argentipes TaxID=94469 RepID=UPI002892BCF8|nr:distal membrane-arm assembly complex protein 2 [Phlebotomus argentipes]